MNAAVEGIGRECQLFKARGSIYDMFRSKKYMA